MRVFITGASGHIGSVVIPELRRAGHEVVGLARSDEAAAAVEALDASVHRGDLNDLDAIREAAADADGVIHLALFDGSQMRAGNMAGAGAAGVAAITAIGDALAGTRKPFVSAAAIGALGSFGRPTTENDAASPGGPTASEITALGLTGRGIRASVVRLPLITHSTPGRHGFAGVLIDIARRTGVSGYAGDGANRWPAVHSRDAGRLFRIVLESAEAGTRWHAVHDEGVALRKIAQKIADHLGLPTASIPEEHQQHHFGFLASLIGLDVPATSVVTRRSMAWEPSHERLLDDMETGDFFSAETD